MSGERRVAGRAWTGRKASGGVAKAGTDVSEAKMMATHKTSSLVGRGAVEKERTPSFEAFKNLSICCFRCAKPGAV